jgi:AcrR family transcriptional regulator
VPRHAGVDDRDAVRQVDEVGGDDVGVRAPSLYKRVRGRDALLSAVAEATIAELAERLDAAGHNLPALAGEFRAYAHERPEGFRLMFTASAPIEALGRAAEPVLATARELVGDEHALDAARLFTAWATGFLQMELAGAFRLGGDVDAAFAYGLDHLLGACRRRRDRERAPLPH